MDESTFSWWLRIRPSRSLYGNLWGTGLDLLQITFSDTKEKTETPIRKLQERNIAKSLPCVYQYSSFFHLITHSNWLRNLQQKSTLS